VRAALGEQPVDLRQHLLGLALHVPLQVLGDDTREVDGIAVLDREREQRSGLMARDAHRLAS